MTIAKVAVIGVGQMGEPMAWNIHKAGFELTVCDPRETARAPFAQAGIRCVERPSDCADCDAVIVLVATPDQTTAVLLGPNGLVEGLSGRTPVVMVMGTITPERMRSLAAALREKGITAVDAPISGGAARARDGTLAIMVGGPEDVFDRLRPLLASMGRAVFHCGPVGSAQVVKIANNIVGITSQMIAAEAYRICLDNGVELADAMPIFDAGSGRNFFTNHVDDAFRAYSTWTDTRPTFESLQSIMRKDIDLALSIGQHSGPLPTIHGLREVLKNVGDETFENWRTVADAEHT